MDQSDDREGSAVSDPGAEALPPPFRFGWTQAQAVCIVGLFALALMYTLYFARDVFLPLVVSLVLMFVFTPVVRYLKRIHLPESVSAAIVVLSLVGSLLAATYTLSDPVSEWLERMPLITRQLEYKLQEARAAIAGLQRVSQNLQRATEEVQKLADGEPAADPQPPTEVVVRPPGMLSELFGGLRDTTFSFVMIFVLLYFLLASGDMFKEKLVRMLPRLQNKKQAIAIWRQVERDTSVYLMTISAINVGLGVAVGTAMHLSGMPNPILWGTMAAILNYIPYLGGIIGIATVAVVALLSFNSLLAAFVPPLSYFALNFLEGQLITPVVLGQRLMLNTVVIFVNLLLWGWLWGIPGILLAGPVLLTIKVFCDHIEALAPLGELLSARHAARQPSPPSAIQDSAPPVGFDVEVRSGG